MGAVRNEFFRSMPYQSNSELPDDVLNTLSNVPHAQDIFRKAFNSAYEEVGEERAFAVAWSAVKQQYEKGDDGVWHPKENT